MSSIQFSFFRKRSVTETSVDEAIHLESDREIEVSHKPERRHVNSQDEEAYFERVESYSVSFNRIVDLNF